MKKMLVLLLSCALVLGCAGCGGSDDDNAGNGTSDASTESDASVDESDSSSEDDTEAEDVKSEGVMTYDEYAAADVDSEVVVETYVQAKQSWWEDKATFYTQDKDGAYFIYDAMF